MNKRIVLVMWWTAVAWSLTTCKGEEEEAVLVPEIIAVDPPAGKVGDRIRVAGHGFVDSLVGNTVTFNGIEVEIVLAKPNRIEVIIPLGLGSGPVIVTNENGTATGPVFEYIKVPVVTTFAGNGTAGFANGTGKEASFNQPTGLTFDGANNLYVFDTGNHVIRKITPEGEVSTYAGTGVSGTANGTLGTATFTQPRGGDFDAHGNLYVVDGIGQIRLVSAEGIVSTVAGKTFASDLNGDVSVAGFNNPTDIEVLFNGDLFVMDYGNNMVRKISGNQVSSFAGTTLPGRVDGVGNDARFDQPVGLASGSASELYVAMNGAIRRVMATREVTTLLKADFVRYQGMTVGNYGELYFCTAGSLDKMKRDGTEIESILSGAGGFEDGIGKKAKFGRIVDVAINSRDEIFISEMDNHAIRKVIFK